MTVVTVGDQVNIESTDKHEYLSLHGDLCRRSENTHHSRMVLEADET